MILDGGGGRLARKLMRQSQQALTVNAVAQAAWVALNRGVSVEESPATQARRHAWEAMYLHSYFVEGHIAKALGSAEKWTEDEPYNHLAYVSMAATANVMLDFETSKRVSKLGLAVAPGSQPLLNTLAFALACTDDLQGAEKFGRRRRGVTALRTRLRCTVCGRCPFRVRPNWLEMPTPGMGKRAFRVGGLAHTRDACAFDANSPI